MLMKQIVKSTGLTKETIKLIMKSIPIDSCSKKHRDYNQDDVSMLIMVSNLMMVRFSLTHIKTMLDNPNLISDTVGYHINELSSQYPYLHNILNRFDLASVHDVYELSAKINEYLILPEDNQSIYNNLKQQCKELLLLLYKATKKYRTANVVDLPAMFPLIGIPFGIIRSIMLSKAGVIMREINELNATLSDNLLQFEINVDFTKIEQPNEYIGLMSDYATSNISPGNYISETSTITLSLTERVWSINEQLKKIK